MPPNPSTSRRIQRNYDDYRFEAARLSSFRNWPDTGLSTYLKEKDNIISQLEFSDKYIDGLTEDVNTATSLRTQLTTIRQIHNVQFHENIRAKLNNKDVKENQSGIQCLNTMQNSSIQNVENNFITVNISRNRNFTVSKEKTISTYFKIQNMNSYAKTKGPPQEKDQRQKHLTLKEKLSKAKSDKDSSSSVPVYRNLCF
ncbi:uncharacterized protein LOC122568045 [Bombus pyrosoma]|uniref:uncharacterized protein LOC122568045 n=1 Tax=Bombus pyrosoma TaxID=396416 RepID=UPI001CB95BB1|nr:uncharacterized protein LOC122568045 [Bombus pyrosoma]